MLLHLASLILPRPSLIPIPFRRLWSLVLRTGVEGTMAQNEKDHMAIEPVMDDEEPMKGEILINVSGHAQELDRRFGFWSVVTMGISGQDIKNIETLRDIGSNV